MLSAKSRIWVPGKLSDFARAVLHDKSRSGFGLRALSHVGYWRTRETWGIGAV